jgi:hypothetical protein
MSDEFGLLAVQIPLKLAFGDYPMSIKLKIARAQLGTALSLFLRDQDPISVHALACGGSEVMEGLADYNDIDTLSSHILETHPHMNMAKIKGLRNQYWNAIKHFYDRDNKTARDDEELMAGFTDEMNDTVLFMGWLDYQLLTKRLPVEVQVFQVWWYATHEKSLTPDVDPTPFRNVFPDIMNFDRGERKRRLKRATEKYRDNKEIFADPRTEQGRLVMPA